MAQRRAIRRTSTIKLLATEPSGGRMTEATRRGRRRVHRPRDAARPCSTATPYEHQRRAAVAKPAAPADLELRRRCCRWRPARQPAVPECNSHRGEHRLRPRRRGNGHAARATSRVDVSSSSTGRCRGVGGTISHANTGMFSDSLTRDRKGSGSGPAPARRRARLLSRSSGSRSRDRECRARAAQQHGEYLRQRDDDLLTVGTDMPSPCARELAERPTRSRARTTPAPGRSFVAIAPSPPRPGHRRVIAVHGVDATSTRRVSR